MLNYLFATVLIVNLFVTVTYQSSAELGISQGEILKNELSNSVVDSEEQFKFDESFRKEIETYVKKKVELEIIEKLERINLGAEDNEDWKEYSRQHFNIVKHIFDETRSSLTTLIQYSVISISIVFATAAFLIRGEFNNFKQVEDRFRKLTEELSKKNEELLDLKEKSQLLKDELTQELDGISEFKENLKKQYSEVYNFLENEKNIKKKRILWAFEASELEDYGMIENLNKDGFNCIDKCYLDVKNIPFNQKYDMVIYSYKKSDQSKKNLGQIIGFIDSFKKDVPLIVFIYDKEKQVKIPDDQISMLQQYGRFSIATTPSRLQSEFKMLIRE